MCSMNLEDWLPVGSAACHGFQQLPIAESGIRDRPLLGAVHIATSPHSSTLLPLSHLVCTSATPSRPVAGFLLVLDVPFGALRGFSLAGAHHPAVTISWLSVCHRNFSATDLPSRLLGRRSVIATSRAPICHRDFSVAALSSRLLGR